MRFARHSASLLWAVALVAAGCTGPTEPKPGSLAVLVSGLPAGTLASVVVTGPGGSTDTLTASDTLQGLKPGQYQIAVTAIQMPDGSRYSTNPAMQVVTVLEGSLASSNVDYAIATGMLAFDISGLPAGTPARVQLLSGNTLVWTAAANDTVRGLDPGIYTVVAQTVTVGVDKYKRSPASYSIYVGANTAPTPAAVVYALASGTLQVKVTGLPAGGDPPTINIGSYVVKSDTTLLGVDVGTYAARSRVSVVGGVRYASSPRETTATVSPGATTTLTMPYAVAPPVNYAIAAAYITQSVQRLDGSVPLVAGRDGLVRVFITADDTSSAKPDVRITLSNAGTAVQTNTLQASYTGFMPETVNADVAAGSYSVRVPGTLIQPGLTMKVELDPTNVYPGEATKSDNTVSRALTVNTVPVVQISVVPIRSTTGTDTSAIPVNGGLDSLLAQTMRMHPVSVIDAVVHPVYTTSLAPFGAGDGSNGEKWELLLNEIDGLRKTEGSPRMYYGLVRVKYNSGIAGIGFVNVAGSVQHPAAIGWDYATGPTSKGGHASSVMAHELGHNWSRSHSPTPAITGSCPTIARPDPNYPYANGTLGQAGWNMSTGAVIPSTGYDVMGYCSPAWISDYTYKAVLDFRSRVGYAEATAPTAASAQPALLVWGRVRRNGSVILEPTFEVATRTDAPQPGGTHTVRGLAADGRVLFTHTFTPAEVADLPGAGRSFALALPLRDADRAALARIEVVGAGGRQTRSVGAAADSDAAGLQVERTATGRTRVRWNAARHGMVLVRDAKTGDVLAFARGGDATVGRGNGELELTFPDRVAARREGRRMRVRVP